MKRSSLIYGFNPYALRSAGRNDPLVAVSLQELARIGIPARKAPRVMQELQALAAADPSLRGRETLLKLARHIAAQLAPTAAKTAPRAGTSPYYFIAPGAAVCYNGCTAPLGRGELHRLRGSQPRRRE